MNKCWVFIVSVAESLSGFIIHVKRIKWFTKSNDQRSFTFKLFRQLWHEAFLPVRIGAIQFRFLVPTSLGRFFMVCAKRTTPTFCRTHVTYVPIKA